MDAAARAAHAARRRRDRSHRIDCRRVSLRAGGQHQHALGPIRRRRHGTQRRGLYARIGLAPTDALTISIGLRGDFWKTDPLLDTDPRRMRRSSARGSASDIVSETVTLQAAVYRAHRTPTLNELYRGFRVGNILTNPNSQLEPEQLTGVEGGALFARGGVSAARRPRSPTRSTAPSPTSRSARRARRSCASAATRTRFAPPASRSKPICALHPTLTVNAQTTFTSSHYPRFGRDADARGQSRAAGAEGSVRRRRDLGSAAAVQPSPRRCAAAAVSTTTTRIRLAVRARPLRVCRLVVSRPIARARAGVLRGRELCSTRSTTPAERRCARSAGRARTALVSESRCRVARTTHDRRHVSRRFGIGVWSTLMTEAWLTGPVPRCHPVLMPAAHSFLQVRNEIARAARGLVGRAALAVAWSLRVDWLPCVHLAGATDRLLTYARGDQLCPSRSRRRRRRRRVHGLDASTLARPRQDRDGRGDRSGPADIGRNIAEPREVGRQRLPSTVLGLIFHAAEHATRHGGKSGTLRRIVVP